MPVAAPFCGAYGDNNIDGNGDAADKPAGRARNASHSRALRLRWRVELVFKRFKSLVGLGALPAKNRQVARSWIFANLIIALMAEKTARKLADSSPSGPA